MGMEGVTRRDDMRKRTIIFGIAALELASIPLAVLFAGKSFAFERVNVIAAEIDAPPGVKQYFVSSDGAFDIISDNLTGPVMIGIQRQGNIGDVSYGGHSQLPGPQNHCAVIDRSEPHIIYHGQSGTILAPGDAVSQAVLVTIFHNQALHPDIEFVQQKKTKSIQIAKTCS